MTELSRSEQRQLQAAMRESLGKDAKDAGEGKKKEAPAAAAPPKKKPAGKTIPGGALNKKKPPPKKPAAGRKRTRKADASESDSSGDSSPDSGHQDSSSSDEEPAPRAVPAKKRAKPGPAAAAASDSEESTFEDEFDEELYKGPEDKRWMMSLNEVEREREIAERLEKRQIAKEMWQVAHQSKKQAAAAPRQQRRKVEPDSRKKAAKAALDDMANKKKEVRKKVQRHEDDSDDEEDARREREREEREERERSPEEREEREVRREVAKPRHRQAPQDALRNAPMIGIEKLESVRVSRKRIIEYINQPFFDQFIIDMFVRVVLKKPMVCQVKGVRDGEPYEVETGDAPLMTTKVLTCMHAGQKKELPVQCVSNREFQRDELDYWCKNMYRDDKPLPDDEDIQECRERIGRNWTQTFVYDDSQVDEMIKESQSSKKKPVNVALSKMHLQEERDLAWEEYKTMEDDEDRNTAYERWEKLREQVQDLEDMEESQKREMMQMTQAGLCKINARARSVNRAVDKKIDIQKNELSSRPYVRTTYWTMPSAGGGEEDKPDSPRVGDPPPSAGAKALAVDTGGKEGTFLDDELEGDTPRGDGPTRTRSAEVLANATSRAHNTELSVQIDTAMSNPKASKKDEEPTLPVRPANPLKPAAAAPAGGAAGKVSLSLEEYKRRRGMLE